MTSNHDNLIKNCWEFEDAASILESELFDGRDFNDAGIRWVNGKWQVYVFYHGEDDEQ